MTTQTVANHAVIIGGSIGGLLTARVLSDYVERVTIVEKDLFSAEPVRRKGTPHAAQFHNLHQAGADIVRDLFPEMPLDSAESGLIPSDVGAEIHAFMYGGWLPKVHVGSNLFWCDRLRFEWALRQRVAALPNVELRGGVTVRGLRYDKLAQRMTGIEVKTDEGMGEISAEIVVDASGRGSRLPQWLNSLDLSQPAESELHINMSDVSATFQLPEQTQPKWAAMVIGTRPGTNNKMGGVYRLPNNQIKVLLAGWFGDHPPTDEAGFVAFSQQLAQPDLYHLLQDATPISPFLRHKLPSNRWRHYEKLRDLPHGLFVLGDAVCSFNPSYGQGMTITAMHAMALDKALRRLQRSGHTIMARPINRRFQKAAGKISQTAWMNATTEDLRYPEAEGTRSLPVRFMQTYLSEVMATAHQNKAITKLFYEVMTLRRLPAALFSPTVLWAMLQHRLRERISAASTQSIEKPVGRKRILFPTFKSSDGETF